ncbi:amidohydrolase [Chloroflexota bacterium]
MQNADMILKNANVVTMDHRHPTAEMVAIKGDKILSVANNGDLEQFKSPKTKVIDCDGRTVIPGFNDAHCHIFSSIRKALSLDLSPPLVDSIQDVKEAIYHRAKNTPKGEWIIGTDYNEFYLAEKRHPTRWNIDEVAPNHPVVLAHYSLHICVLNSMALSLANISIETQEPTDGLIDRDINTGEPNGILFEMLTYVREKVLPPLKEEEIFRGIGLVDRQYLSQGITSLQDATVSNNINRWQMFHRLKDTDRLRSRMSMMFGVESLPQFQKQGFTIGSGDSHIRLGGIKLMLNETTGRLQPPQSEINKQALAAHKAGFQLAIHAVEQSCVEAAIAALEYVHSKLPRVDPRHRIEHCSHCPPQLIRRLGDVKGIVVTQAPFIYYSGERYLATLPTDHVRWLYPVRSWLDNNVIVANSSDSPVVPNNPLIGIYATITRRAETGQQLPLEECTTAKEALAMNTINAAFASFEENIKGSIIPGKLADMVVLSDNPVTSPPERLKEARVQMTIIGGQVVWEE